MHLDPITKNKADMSRRWKWRPNVSYIRPAVDSIIDTIDECDRRKSIPKKKRTKTRKSVGIGALHLDDSTSNWNRSNSNRQTQKHNAWLPQPTRCPSKASRHNKVSCLGKRRAPLKYVNKNWTLQSYKLGETNFGWWFATYCQNRSFDLFFFMNSRRSRNWWWVESPFLTIQAPYFSFFFLYF